MFVKRGTQNKVKGYFLKASSIVLAIVVITNSSINLKHSRSYPFDAVDLHVVLLYLSRALSYPLATSPSLSIVAPDSARHRLSHPLEMR